MARRLAFTPDAVTIANLPEHNSLLAAPLSLALPAAQVGLLKLDKLQELAQFRRVQMCWQLVTMWRVHSDKIRILLFNACPQDVYAFGSGWTEAVHLLGHYPDPEMTT
jgi:hypothetical protein